MARPRKSIPPARLNLALPRDVRDRLDLYLYSQAEHGVPLGAYQTFLVGLINDYLRGSRPLKARTPLTPLYDAVKTIKEIADFDHDDKAEALHHIAIKADATLKEMEDEWQR